MSYSGEKFALVGRTWTQNQFDALVSLSFNAGKQGSDDVIEQIIRGVDPTSAFCEYIEYNGEDSLGLYRRRMDEAEMFLYSDYSRNHNREFPNS